MRSGREFKNNNIRFRWKSSTFVVTEFLELSYEFNNSFYSELYIQNSFLFILLWHTYFIELLWVSK